MFYTRAYLKIEGEKRQGEMQKVIMTSNLPSLLKAKDGRKDRPL